MCTDVYIYRVERGLRAAVPFMCGPCHVLGGFGFTSVLWSVLGWNVGFYGCCADVPCLAACCGGVL